MANRDISGIPKEEIKSLFWDTDLNNIDIEKHKEYIIKRILEYGDIGSVKWMFKNYSKDLIKDVLNSSRGISKKSSFYWKLVLNEVKK